MTWLEAAGYWLALSSYAGALTVIIVTAIFKQSWKIKLEVALAGVGWLAHTMAIASRALAAGHLPYTHAYENALSAGWFLPLIYFLIARRYRDLPRLVFGFVLAAAMAVMSYGYTTDTSIAAATPPFQSGYLFLHVFFACLSHTLYIIATGCALVVIWPQTTETVKELYHIRVYRLILLGFFCHTVMLLSGSIWAHYLWGSYWGWDPIETWTLISWLFYGIYIHLFRSFRIKKEYLAIIAIAGLAGVLIFFWGVGFWMDSVHSQFMFDAVP